MQITRRGEDIGTNKTMDDPQLQHNLTESLYRSNIKGLLRNGGRMKVKEIAAPFLPSFPFSSVREEGAGGAAAATTSALPTSCGRASSQSVSSGSSFNRLQWKRNALLMHIFAQ